MLRLTRWIIPVSIMGLVIMGVVLLSMPQPAAHAAPPSKRYPKMMTKRTMDTISKGLEYLKRTQRHNGSWVNSAGYGSYPVTMTSLAGLAMLASGSTPESGPYSTNVRKALNYVLNTAESNFRAGDHSVVITSGNGSGRSMYDHGFGMLFLAQCYGVEGDKSSNRGVRLKTVLDKAVALTAKAQSDLGAGLKHAGGWIYTPTGRSDEGSVTVTQLQALRACRNVGIKVPMNTIQRAVLYLKHCQKSDGGICYSARSRGNSLPAISAAAVACFYSAGIYDQKTGGAGDEAKMVEKLVQYVKTRVSVNGHSGHYFYTHLYMAQGMYQRGGKDWENYYPKIRDRLVNSQSPDGNWNGDNVGQTYGTAIGLLILQLPYGYLPITQK